MKIFHFILILLISIQIALGNPAAAKGALSHVKPKLGAKNPVHALKKAPAKKPELKKAPAKKPALKKAPVKKPALKKAPVKKPALKKAPVKKPALKKAPVKKLKEEAPHGISTSNGFSTSEVILTTVGSFFGFLFLTSAFDYMMRKMKGSKGSTSSDMEEESEPLVESENINF